MEAKSLVEAIVQAQVTQLLMDRAHMLNPLDLALAHADHKLDELGFGRRCDCSDEGQNWLLMLAGKTHCQGF